MKYEACIRITEPNPKAQARGKAKGDVIVVKPVGSAWSDAERNGVNLRVIEIETKDDEDDRVGFMIQGMIDLGLKGDCVANPYSDAAVQSTLRIDLDAVDPAKLASGQVIKEADGYTRSRAGFQETTEWGTDRG